MNLDQLHVTDDLGDGDLRRLLVAHAQLSEGTCLPELHRRYHHRMARAVRGTLRDRATALAHLELDLGSGDAECGGIVDDPAALEDELDRGREELRRAVRRDAGAVSDQ